MKLTEQIQFVKHFNGGFGYKYDILPEQFEKIKQKFYDKVKEKLKGYSKRATFVVIEINPAEKPYYTIYGSMFLIGKVMYEIEQGE